MKAGEHAPAITLEPVEGPDGQRFLLNYGPQHPGMHGTLRLEIELDGERIVRVDQEIGYLHTGFEKLGENLTYNQWITASDRMNYMSAFANNLGFAIACEEMLGIEPPPRAQVLRVILVELTRIADHALALGLQAMDLGAFSTMLWAFVEREKVYDIIQAACGMRLTTSYTRVGGLFRDVPDSFDGLVRQFLKEFPRFVKDLENLLNKNRIFRDRCDGAGIITEDDVYDYSLTGPIARASGVGIDIRRTRPYSGYETYDFEVPVHTGCDSFARWLQRLAEMKESLRIIEQGLGRLAPGPVMYQDHKFTLPDKMETYTNMEALIHQFKLVMEGHGLKPEPGVEWYSCTESPNGELGFYLMSDGTAKPYRLRVRPPSFINYAVFKKLIEGKTISDIVAILSTINVIAGELDR